MCFLPFWMSIFLVVIIISISFTGSQSRLIQPCSISFFASHLDSHKREFTKASTILSGSSLNASCHTSCAIACFMCASQVRNNSTLLSANINSVTRCAISAA